MSDFIAARDAHHWVASRIHDAIQDHRMAAHQALNNVRWDDLDQRLEGPSVDVIELLDLPD